MIRPPKPQPPRVRETPYLVRPKLPPGETRPGQRVVPRGQPAKKNPPPEKSSEQMLEESVARGQLGGDSFKMPVDPQQPVPQMPKPILTIHLA